MCIAESAVPMQALFNRDNVHFALCPVVSYEQIEQRFKKDVSEGELVSRSCRARIWCFGLTY